MSESHAPEPRRYSDVQIHNVIETAMDGIISINAQQQIILFNKAAEAIFGRNAEQVIGKPIDLLIPQRFRATHQHDVEQFGKGLVPVRRMGGHRTVMAMHARGHEFPIEASISTTIVSNEKIYTVILRDVTEAVKSRQQIEQQSQMLAQVSDAVSVTNTDGHFTYWNQAAARLYGWTADEVLNQQTQEAQLREIELLRRIISETDLQGSWSGEVNCITRSGKRIIVEHRRTLLCDAEGHAIGHLCLDIDITERKKRERTAHRSQRLESIGTLAGGIAHDLNNVLTPILMGAKLLANGRNPSNRQGLLETMVASAQRGADLIKQLLSFAGGIQGDHGPVRVEQLIAETRALLGHTLPKSIHIKTIVDAECPLVMADSTELSQILMNLCINARDAMPVGGQLTIEARSIVIDKTTLRLHPDAAEDHYVVVKVSDTGTGMTAEILDRIFDPFFTTKEVGKGTGLGLATVQGIVKSHGGFITVYSEPGNGSTFSVYIPALKSDIDTAEIKNAPAAQSGEGHTILLVDDETFILQMTGAALTRADYRVLTAVDGISAVKLFQQHRHDISAVLLDMMMPGMDGLNVLDQLKLLDPHIVVVACSGLRTSQRESDVLDRGAKAFLPKPYSEEELLHVLTTVLNRPG